MGEEEDDDYKDLYNDIDVGEGLLQSLHKNNGSRFQNGDVKENKPLLSLPIPNAAGFRLWVSVVV